MGSGSLSEVTREFMCPFMKCGYGPNYSAAARCGGTDTERPVLPIAGCHIYTCVCLCVCVCVSMMFGGDG